jgi:hypothetical protein
MKLLAYIIDTHINGNITHAKAYFKQYQNKTENLKSDIIEVSELFGIDTTIKILKKLGVSDTNLINAFYDYSNDNLDEVKTILLNNY